MVRRQHVDVQVQTSADAATVYALLRDGATWPTWSPIESFQLERVGELEPEGLGAIRMFRKGYRADVDLESGAGVTVIRWHTSFRPIVPGTGWLLRWQIERFVRQCAQGLAVHAQTSPAPK